MDEQQARNTLRETDFGTRVRVTWPKGTGTSQSITRGLATGPLETFCNMIEEGRLALEDDGLLCLRDLKLAVAQRAWCQAGHHMVVVAIRPNFIPHDFLLHVAPHIINLEIISHLPAEPDDD